MSKKRRQYSAKYKFQVALEAVKGQKTISQLSSEHSIYPNQIRDWKRKLMEEGVNVFARENERREQEQAAQEAELYEQIGRLKMELEWLKKKLPRSPETKRQMVEWNHPLLSIRRQCELLGLNRSTLYYELATESEFNLHLMRLLDEHYLQMPFLGVLKMTELLRDQGYQVNPKRVRCLLRKMGLMALYPRPKTTKPGKEYKIYPYLLRNLPITYANQVWSSDITYIPISHGFMYLVAVMDWFSRYVLSWRLSNTLDGSFCLDALHQALQWGKPQIFNTDQGSQFTAHAFTGALVDAEIQISMDGRGRAFDNIFNERLWRSVKYENVYINDYDSVSALELGLSDYFELYNHVRPHQSLEYRTPAHYYFSLRNGLTCPV